MHSKTKNSHESETGIYTNILSPRNNKHFTGIPSNLELSKDGKSDRDLYKGGGYMTEHVPSHYNIIATDSAAIDQQEVDK